MGIVFVKHVVGTLQDSVPVCRPIFGTGPWSGFLQRKGLCLGCAHVTESL